MQHVWNAVIAVSRYLVFAQAAPIAAPRRRWVNYILDRIVMLDNFVLYLTNQQIWKKQFGEKRV